MLKIAGSMRREGALPRELALWAVENPMRNPATRLEAKVPFTR
jgi:hypothetical protein